MNRGLFNMNKGYIALGLAGLLAGCSNEDRIAELSRQNEQLQTRVEQLSCDYDKVVGQRNAQPAPVGVQVSSPKYQPAALPPKPAESVANVIAQNAVNGYVPGYTLGNVSLDKSLVPMYENFNNVMNRVHVLGWHSQNESAFLAEAKTVCGGYVVNGDDGPAYLITDGPSLANLMLRKIAPLQKSARDTQRITWHTWRGKARENEELLNAERLRLEQYVREYGN